MTRFKIVSILLIAVFASTNLPVFAATPDRVIEAKITALLAKMTVAEKLGQLQQLNADGQTHGAQAEHFELARRGLLGSMLGVRGAENANAIQRAALESRLKIPVLLGFDVIHGYRTIFPIPLGESASWDLAAIERSAHIAAIESRAAGVHWTFAPMVDIARDPRWGRIAEGAGEDPFLGSKIAFARVRGFQGTDLSDDDRVMACAKHFAAYGAALAGRDYGTTDMSVQTLRDVYFPPFKAAADAGVGSFMTSFNSLNGVPSTANPFLWKQVLRTEWKSDALVVTDYTATMELLNHGVAADESEAAMKTLNAGVDMEMVSRFINKHGAQLLKERKISMATLDSAVRAVLRAKFKLGLFDRPLAVPARERTLLLTADHRRVARETAAKSFVLLKNDAGTLPIAKNTRRFAVVGPLGNDQRNMLGNWSGDGKSADAVTVLTGLKNKLGTDAEIRFAAGCDVKCGDTDGFEDAIRTAAESDFVIVAVGEEASQSGEAASRSDIGLPGKQLELVKAIHALGKPYAVVLMNGRPLTINWIAENSPAILETWFAGTEAGNAIADVLFGDVDPGGKLPVTFPRNVGQIPIFYSELPTGRPFEEANKFSSKYLDVPNTPLFPFGFGLSYTTFRISDLDLRSARIAKKDTLRVSVSVENIGRRDGAEVVQVYVRDLAASVSRPVKELKGFARVELKAGEKRRVEIEIPVAALGFHNAAGKYVVEDGRFRIVVSSDSVSERDDLVGFVTVAN